MLSGRVPVNIIREKKIWELDSIFSKRKFFEMKEVFVCVFYILVCYFKICRLYEKDDQNFLMTNYM